MPYYYNVVEHCVYYQSPRHTIDKYYHLRHDIQDLIDEGIVSFNPTPTNPPPNLNII